MKEQLAPDGRFYVRIGTPVGEIGYFCTDWVITQPGSLVLKNGKDVYVVFSVWHYIEDERYK